MSKCLNRKRPIGIFFRVNNSELENIKLKMNETGMQNKEEFIRKMLQDGCIINVDTKDINALSVQISRYGNNLNQIAKRVNETNHIYKEDINDIIKQQEAILNELKNIYNEMSLIINRRK